MATGTVVRADGGRLSTADNPWTSRGLKPGTKMYAQRCARLCYGHLAGRIGVAVTAALIHGEFLTGGNNTKYDESRTTLGLNVPTLTGGHWITAAGEALFGKLDIDLDTLRAGHGTLVRPCRDWTEQVPHLAGSLGYALAQQLIVLGYLRRNAVPRALELTAMGRTVLPTMIGVELPQ